jgi:hypothetical protein
MKLGIALSCPSQVTAPAMRATFRQYADEVTIHKPTAAQVAACFADVAEALAEAKHTDDCVAMVLRMTAPTVRA